MNVTFAFIKGTKIYENQGGLKLFFLSELQFVAVKRPESHHTVQEFN